MVLGGGAHGGMFTKARLVRRNLCSRSRESVGWGSGRECEEAVRRYSHLREFMFQGVKVNSCSQTPATSMAPVEKLISSS